jgi:YVTN family beta-propeller protein
MKKFALALTLGSLLAPTSIQAQNAYVTNESSSTVSVIDTAIDAVIATIPVGLFPGIGVVTPDGSKVYVTTAPSNPFGSPGSAIVSVIDTATNTAIATIPVDDQHTLQPGGVAVTSDGSKVYVGVDDNSFGSLSVIDTATNAVSATIPLGSSTVGGVAVTPDGSKVYAASGGAIFVIDTATNTDVSIQPPPRFAGVPGSNNCYMARASRLWR